MNNFFEKPTYTEEDIYDLIKNQIEEAIDLEFKDAAALDNTDKKKNEISKDVASFANSAGGIIVYGISEDRKNRATSISYIDGNKITKEWLEQVIHSNIKQKIDNIEIFPVRFDNDIARSVYIIKIPQSNSSPHMSRDNKYYRRYNFQSVPMEEYEVRNLYYMTHKTDLEIVGIVPRLHQSTGNLIAGMHKVIFELQFKVFNSGKSIESVYKIKLQLPNAIFYNDPLWKSEYTLEHNGEKSSILSFSNSSPLFQGERVYSECFYVIITKRSFEKDENLMLRTTLYYSNGIKEYKFDLREHLKIDDIPIGSINLVGN